MKFYFEEAKIWRKTKQDTIQEINESGYPLVLFGRSANTNPAFLKQITVPILYVLSNNPASWGKTHWGYEVVGPQVLEELKTDYNTLILVVACEEIFVNQLTQLLHPPKRIFSLDFHFDTEDPVSFFDVMRGDVEKIYDTLADQESKDAYETVLHYRVNRDLRIFNGFQFPPESQYFPEELSGRKFLRSRETFVDCGAFCGW